MTNHTGHDWEKMVFAAPRGHREVLWVAPIHVDRFSVLNVPVWLYGVSVGAVVHAVRDGSGLLHFERVVEPSVGGTIRVMVPHGGLASRTYLDVIGPTAARAGISVGPATFFDPLIVALHISRRVDTVSAIGDVLGPLREQGVIRGWEIADPSDDEDEEEEGELSKEAGELVHPKPDAERLKKLCF